MAANLPPMTQQLLKALADQAVIRAGECTRFAQVDQALARRAQEWCAPTIGFSITCAACRALNALGMAINTTLRGADEILA